MSDRDEAAVPMDQIAEVVERVLGEPKGLSLLFQERKGRSEKITMRFDNGGTITITAGSCKAGESRRALIAFLERCEQLGRDVRTRVEQ